MKNRNLSGKLFAAKSTPLTGKETLLTAQIGEWLDNRRIYNDCLRRGKVKKKRGHRLVRRKNETPEKFAIVSGRIIFIEVKRFGEKLTSEQHRRHYELRENGAIVIVCASIAEFINQFSAIRAAIENARKGASLYD